MSDQDDFELRLGAAVKVFAVGGDRPFDASQLAASALRTRNDGWLTRQFKRPAQGSHVLATAAIAVVFVAVASFAIALYAGRPSGNIAGPISTEAPLVTPSPSASAIPAMSASPPGYMWPQSTLEVQAQVAEPGPRYAWQVARDLNEAELSQHHPGDATDLPPVPRGGARLGGSSSMAITFPVRTMSISTRATSCTSAAHRAKRTRCTQPTPKARGCAPTIDELRYETVKITVAQPDRQGAYGIWVVTGWEMIGPAVQADPRVDEAEASALVEDFLQARIGGDGAEELADFADGCPTSGSTGRSRSCTPRAPGPLTSDRSSSSWKARRGHVAGCSSTSGCSPRTTRPWWSSASRCTAIAGRQRIVYDLEGATTENGKAVPVEYSLLDGEVTYRAAAPLMPSRRVSSTGTVAIERPRSRRRPRGSS